MRKEFVASDHHFGHENIIVKGDGRTQFSSIKEHDEFIVEKHNSVVGPKDRTYFLGDVCFGRERNNSFEKLSRMNGEKILVPGNHDAYAMHFYLEHFSKVIAYISFKEGLLSHIPVHPSQLEKRYLFNIHGHLHDRQLEDARYRCVSLEQINYTPVLLDDVIKDIKYSIEFEKRRESYFETIIYRNEEGKYLMMNRIQTHVGVHDNIGFTDDINKAYTGVKLPYGTLVVFKLERIKILVIQNESRRILELIKEGEL